MSGYDTDIVTWSERQAALLRQHAATARSNDPAIDWPNIIVEIESVGRSERAALASHVRTILEHLAKLEASPRPPNPGPDGAKPCCAPAPPSTRYWRKAPACAPPSTRSSSGS